MSTGPWSKNWCKGFCRTCGTGCAEYCEQIHRLQLKVDALEKERDALGADRQNWKTLANERAGEIREACERLRKENKKLHQLLLLVDPAVRDVAMNSVTQRQWAELERWKQACSVCGLEGGTHKFGCGATAAAVGTEK